jgi:hypothetical protein
MKTSKLQKSWLAITLFLAASNFSTLASDSNGGSVSQSLHSSGKIYVVVAVVVLLFVVFAAFLFLMERRISKLENRLKNKN